MVDTAPLQQFYIAEEQSIYLLGHHDAQKLKQWLRLCEKQLARLGYRHIRFVGKGVYGFVFAGRHPNGQEQVFKFSRITLPAHLQARLEEEAWMLEQVDHPNIPKLIRYQQLKLQGIMVMTLAPGRDLAQLALRCGPLPLSWLAPIAQQLAQLLRYLRQDLPRPIVHGDIKPSNLVFDPSNHHLSLIDWGSAVFAQQDASGEPIAQTGLGVGGEPLRSNARMGDLYFIGAEQLAGSSSSPRFDEQGVAGTLYSLASGLPARFGSSVLPAASLGLPKALADTLDAMLSDDPIRQRQGGDHFIDRLTKGPAWQPPSQTESAINPQLPVWVHQFGHAIDTVAYSSRKSFLQQHQSPDSRAPSGDLQIDRYYRDYLVGMGDCEKAFVTAVGRLGEFPILGGLALHWHGGGVAIDSSLNLFDPTLRAPFAHAVNNLVRLAQSIPHHGVFKACFFNARDTLHIERDNEALPFQPAPEQAIPFEVAEVPELEDKTRLHSYFEDGRDPDENLSLPAGIMAELGRLNDIHHTGCIIFEVLPTHLKLHSYLKLLDTQRHQEFSQCLQRILSQVNQIQEQGISGFMKLPYKNTRHFVPRPRHPARYLTPPRTSLARLRQPKP
ncbi:non-specific serine/threonine protein kinase [Ferrimonas sediminum]|uniref:Non-specific serine/threonine protein kinase n=1 Tax=Ferrimonas sediminum TaxID=718193 RepID=A0A1G8UXY3_9GAMM|nr:phosphotransferase [Ferrimonas sediminum]SDJ58722.1 non-specific serine/threonine protein kinase [Ferrimonas sediminum]